MTFGYYRKSLNSYTYIQNNHKKPIKHYGNKEQDNKESVQNYVFITLCDYIFIACELNCMANWTRIKLSVGLKENVLDY